MNVGNHKYFMEFSIIYRKERRSPYNTFKYEMFISMIAYDVKMIS